MYRDGPADVPVEVSGNALLKDATAPRAAGAAPVYSPKDSDITAIMRDIVSVYGAWRKAA